MTIPWSAKSRLALDLVTSASAGPRRWVRLPYPARVAFTPRPVEDLFETDSGRIYTTRRGPDAIDLTIDLGGGHIPRAVMEQIEDIRRSGAPVYVYPRWPGSAQYLWPLSNGLRGDPMDLSVASDNVPGSVLYALRASAAHGGAALVPVDISRPVLQSGVYCSPGVEAPFPLGRGVYAGRLCSNELRNTLFGDVSGGAPADWTAAGGTPGVDMGVLPDSWLGPPALWIHGQNATWASATTSYSKPQTCYNLAFGWLCDGQMRVSLMYNAGASDIITVGPGAGYYRGYFARSEMFTSIRLVAQLHSGATYGELIAPRGNIGQAVSTGLFIGSAGAGTTVWRKEEISASGLHIEAPAAGLLCVSGYVMPAWADHNEQQHGLVMLANTRQGTTVGCALGPGPSPGMATHLTVTQEENIVGRVSFNDAFGFHARGDAYAFCLYMGRGDDSNPIIGCTLARIVTSSTVGSPGMALDTGCYGTIAPCGAFDEIRPGETNAAFTYLDGLLGGYAVHSLPSRAAASTYVRQMADPNYVDLWRNLYARQYRILPQISPSRWQRQMWGGTDSGATITLQQVREL